MASDINVIGDLQILFALFTYFRLDKMPHDVAISMRLIIKRLAQQVVSNVEKGELRRIKRSGYAYMKFSYKTFIYILCLPLV